MDSHDAMEWERTIDPSVLQVKPSTPPGTESAEQTPGSPTLSKRQLNLLKRQRKQELKRDSKRFMYEPPSSGNSSNPGQETAGSRSSNIVGQVSAGVSGSRRSSYPIQVPASLRVESHDSAGGGSSSKTAPVPGECDDEKHKELCVLNAADVIIQELRAVHEKSRSHGKEFLKMQNHSIQSVSKAVNTCRRLHSTVSSVQWTIPEAILVIKECIEAVEKLQAIYGVVSILFGDLPDEVRAQLKALFFSIQGRITILLKHPCFDDLTA